jgi:hypothetical protein
VEVNHLASQFACPYAVRDEETKFRTNGNRLECPEIATSRAQFGKSISPQPRRGMLFGVASGAQEFGEQPAAAPYQQGRRPSPAHPDGARSPLHSGEDSDLRRWGLRLAECGGKNAKKRAIVAVARMLAVLLHKLWVNGEAYEPLRNHPTTAVDAVA